MTSRAAVVVAGLGRIGRLHAENLAARVPSAWLAGVVDPVEPRARSVGERHGVPWSTSLDGMLEGADGVVIAAPTRLHAEMVTVAAEAGRHAMCEKPLGFHAGGARRAVQAAAAADVRLQIGFQRRFDPGWRELKRALDGGELGRLHLVRCSHRDARPPGDGLGDLFADVAVHDLDSARWLGGEVAEVHARARARFGAVIVLRFESGALGSIDVSRDAAYGFECSAEVVGATATARCGYGRAGTEVLREGGTTAPLARDHAECHRQAYVAELEHFGRLIRGRATPAATGEDAIAALELVEAARRAAEA